MSKKHVCGVDGLPSLAKKDWMNTRLRLTLACHVDRQSMLTMVINIIFIVFFLSIYLYFLKKTQKVLAEIHYQIIGWPIKYRLVIQKSYFSKCYQNFLYGIHIANRLD